MGLFQIVTDSTADLPKEYLEQNDIICFNLSYTILDKTYGQGEELPYKDFYSLMREGNIPKTAQINPEDAKNQLLKVLEKCNDILYLAFSSGLSGTYNSGRLAAEEIMEEHPEAHIVVIDSRCASMGEGLFVHKCVELKKAGKSFDEVCEWANDHIDNMTHIFTVDDLNHLFRGGRVSRTAAVVGTVLSIKPILHVDTEGHLIPIGKERGRKKSLLSLVDYMEKKMGQFGPENEKMIFISHGDCEEDALFVKDEIEKRFGYHNFMINHIGPTIGAHSGPGTVALFFMGEDR